MSKTDVKAAIHEAKVDFHMCTFGCIENPYCYPLQGEVYVEKICKILGKSAQETKDAVMGMLGTIQPHVRKKLNGDKVVRAIFVKDWVNKYLLG